MNAVKYAYPEGAGPIHVELKALGDNIELAISDDGVGLNVKVDPRSTGMGQRIVSAMAAKPRLRRGARVLTSQTHPWLMIAVRARQPP